MNEFTRDVRVTHDEQADAAYIYLRHPVAPGSVAHTVSAEATDVASGSINLDFDAAGRLIGIEILQAYGVLPEEFLNITHPG